MWRQKNKDGTTQLVGGGLTLAGVINAMYPVGSIYLTTTAANPSTYLGGTWAAFGAGRALVGVGNNGENTYVAEQVFGADAVTLTAAQSGVNSHTHTGTAQPSAAPGWSSGISANHTHAVTSLQKTANASGTSSDNGGGSVAQGTPTGRFAGAQTASSTGTVSSDHQHYIGPVETTNVSLKPPDVTSHENRQRSIAVYAWKRTA